MKRIIYALTAITLLLPLNVLAEDETVLDASADFTVNVTDSTPPTVVSYVTTINQDISIDISKNYNGYAWVKVENKSDVPITVTMDADSIEPIGNNTIPTMDVMDAIDYKELHPDDKYVVMSLYANDTLMSKDYNFTKSMILTAGGTYNFESQNDNIGLYEIHAQLSNNWLIEETDELTYSVTSIITPMTYRDAKKYESDPAKDDSVLYASYDSDNDKLYVLTILNDEEFSCYAFETCTDVVDEGAIARVTYYAHAINTKDMKKISETTENGYTYTLFEINGTDVKANDGFAIINAYNYWTYTNGNSVSVNRLSGSVSRTFYTSLPLNSNYKKS